ncbi:MAG TPA: nuclear transport factor 2 family protein [Pseudonocardia sp.]|jgi:hypothetical protein
MTGVLVLVPACGVAPDTEQSSPAREANAIEEAVRSYTSAFLRGDGRRAHELLSERCQEAVSPDVLQGQAAEAAARYGQARLDSVMPRIAGDRAAVTYRFDRPALDREEEPWVKEDGDWRNDHC